MGKEKERKGGNDMHKFVRNNKMDIPEEGFFPSMDNVFVWLTNKKGEIKEIDGKPTIPATALKEGLQEDIRSKRWHTSTLLNSNKRELFEHSVLTVKFGSFTKENLETIRKYLNGSGLEIVLCPAKWVNGGRGSAVSKLLISDRQVIFEMAEKMGIRKELEELPTAKKISRLSMIAGENVEFKTPNGIPLNVKILKGDSEGRSWISSEIADLNGYKHVCKLGGVSKDVALVNDTICKMYDVDIVTNEGGDKFNIEDEEKFAELVGHKPSCHPRVSYGKSLPTFRWDIQIMQEDTPKPDLSIEKEIMKTGKIPAWYVLKNMSYEDEDGEVKLMNRIKPIMIGGTIWNVNRIKTVMKSLKTAVSKKFWRRELGKYGVLCDIEEIPDYVDTKEVVAFMYPNQRPIETEGKIWSEAGLIGIPREIIFREGRDLDGDGIVAIPRDSMDWSIDPHNNPLELPEKGDGSTADMNAFNTWAEMVEIISKVGSVHNDSGVINSVMVDNGITDKEKSELISEMLYMDETYIHGFKHGFNDDTPELDSRASEKELDMDKIERESDFAGVIRNGTLEDIIEMAADAKEDGPFFERIASQFKDWDIGEEPEMDDKLGDKLNNISKRTLYKMGKNVGFKDEYTDTDYELRWNITKKLLRKQFDKVNTELGKKFILTAYNNKEYSWANFLYDKWINSKDGMKERIKAKIKKIEERFEVSIESDPQTIVEIIEQEVK